MWLCFSNTHTFVFFSLYAGLVHGALIVAQAHRLAPVRGHSPFLPPEEADLDPDPDVTVDHYPDPLVARVPAPTLHSLTGGRGGAAGRGRCKHVL